MQGQLHFWLSISALIIVIVRAEVAQLGWREIEIAFLFPEQRLAFIMQGRRYLTLGIWLSGKRKT